MGKDFRLFRYLLAVVVSLVLATPLSAQFRSSIEGTITDSERSRGHWCASDPHQHRHRRRPERSEQ